MATIINKDNGSSGASPSEGSKANILRYGVGFDVHKFKIAVCIAGQVKTGDTVILKEQPFPATPLGLDELIGFLGKYQPVTHYLMECTGVYHLPLYHALRKAFPDQQKQIIAMNPLLLNRRLTDLDSHTDKVDARGLARLSFFGSLLRPSYVGTQQFFQMRDFIRSYHKSRIHCGRLRQRIRRTLATVNCKFDFDLSKEWCLTLLDYFIHRSWSLQDAYDQLLTDYKEACRPLKVIQKQKENVAIFGKITLPEATRHSLQLNFTRFLQEEIIAASFLRKAETMVLNSRNSGLDHAYQRVRMITGVGGVSALTIVLELGNYYRFETWKALAKYCGVVPMIYQSGQYQSKGHVNRFSNKYLRRTLTQTAAVLINRSNRDTDLSRFAHRQYRVRKLPFKKATLKVAQKLARTVYYVLLMKGPYDPNYEQTMRKKQRIQRKLARQKTLLETPRLKALKRDVRDFLVTNYDFLNANSRYHLTAGFKRLIRKAKYLERQQQQHPDSDQEEKKRNRISKGD
jgi:transposase